MKLLDFFIPKQKAQKITEVESYTVKWKYHDGNHIGVRHKVFVTKEEAEEFEKQVNGCANFIGVWVWIELYKN